MHPAYSVIVFTAASGAGYGLLFWLGLGHLAGALPGGWPGLAALGVSLGLITVGLLSSTLHLGRPERAWRALSQWRSSWLSREGIAALATFVPAGLMGALWLAGTEGGASRALGLLAALGAAATVYCTGMIYASLRTVRHWHRRDVPVIYLVLAAGTGALTLAFVLALFGAAPVWILVVSGGGLALAGALKARYWAAVDGAAGAYTAARALGFGAGPVRVLDPPHTMPNFVMREMGYAVARRHAARLRLWALAGLVAVPLALLALAPLIGWGALPLALAVLAALAGTFVERWLFFAEAEHVSMLYYGRARA